MRRLSLLHTYSIIMEHLNRKLQQLLLDKIALDNSLMISLPKSILQEAIQGKLVPQIPE